MRDAALILLRTTVHFPANSIRASSFVFTQMFLKQSLKIYSVQQEKLFLNKHHWYSSIFLQNFPKLLLPILLLYFLAFTSSTALNIKDDRVCLPIAMYQR